MDTYYNNIKQLIENNLVEVKKNEIKSNYHTLMTYHGIGKQLIEAQGGEARAKYGNKLIKEYSIKLEEEYGNKYNTDSLKRYRQFYLLFPKGAALRHQLTWTYYKTLLPIKNENKRTPLEHS